MGVPTEAPKMLARGRYQFTAYLSNKSYFFRIAEYKDLDGNKYIAKIWTSKNKDKNYYRIKNELVAYRTFWEILQSEEYNKITKDFDISIPKLEYYEEEKTRLVLLLEKIPGVPLGEIPNKERIRVVDQSITFLQTLFESSENPTKLGLRNIKPLFFILMIFLLMPLSLAKNLKLAPSLLKLYLFVPLSVIPILKCKELSFVHRDLHPWNIISVKEKSYLFDLEIISIGPKSHDLGNAIFRSWNMEDNAALIEYMNNLKTSTNYYELKFMCIYGLVYDLVFNVSDTIPRAKGFIEYLKYF
ncbi:MAG TPA: phosphotransferase [Niabella sp.]|nr:phosphotransferase [Niabella sp.]HUN01919.1 phosphotransferase [Niabella sp.]